MGKQFRTRPQQTADDIMELLASLERENFKLKFDYKILSQNFTSTVVILESVIDVLTSNNIVNQSDIKKAFTKLSKKYKKESDKKSKEITNEYKNLYLDSLLNSDIHANS